MTDAALVSRQGPHQILMTTPYHAAGALRSTANQQGRICFFAVVRGAVLPSEPSVSLREA